jgi:hypothetical protein
MNTFKYLPLGYKKDDGFKTYHLDNISILRDDIYIRSIKYFDIEIIKLISFLIRDKNWNNYIPKKLNQKILINKKTINFKFDLEFSDKYQKLITTNSYIIKSNSIIIKSKGRFLTDFETNRAGFNILLPLKNVVGEKIRVTDSNSNILISKFPVTILPDQPFINMSAIDYSMKNMIKLNFKFQGIKFEMEDQRNWGDASFKIYSGSLLDPFPYLIKKNTNFFQQIEINFKHIKSLKNLKNIKSANIKIQKKLNIVAPKIGIKFEDSNYKILYKNDLNFDFVLKEFDLTKSNFNVFDFKKINININLFAIFLIDHNDLIDNVINKIINILKKIDCEVSYIFICPKTYLNSYQPTGIWPNVPLLSEYNKKIKKKLKNIKIASGMVTNFTELNRKRPVGNYDIISFSFTPIVHDASDHGILETPETIDHIFKTLKKINSQCDIHIGPISLGMHHNPYGKKLIKNSKKTRIEMTNQDLRHDSLFSIVWSVGMYQELSKHNIKLLTFNNLFGHHGIYEKNFNKRPLYIFNKVITNFAEKKLCVLSYNINFYSICILEENKYKILISNKTRKIKNVTMSKYQSLKSSYINEKNFNSVLKNIDSFFELKDIDNNLKFLPYETKYIEIIK